MLFMAQTPEERKTKPAVTGGFPLDISALRSIASLIGAPTTALIDRTHALMKWRCVVVLI